MTASQYYEYSFLGFICMGLLIQNYFNMRRYGHQTLSGKFLRFCVLTLVFGCVLEIAYGLREAGLLRGGDVFAYVEEILYACATMFAGYFWYISSELYQRSRMTATRKMRIIVSIPLLIMVVMTVLTPLHHLNFSFENGYYVRGPFVIVSAVVMYAFIATTGVAALVRSFRKQFYMERGYLRIIFLYTVVLTVFVVLQLLVGSVMPFETMGAVLVMHIVQQRYIKENVYVDNMLGCNNRNAVEKYLHSHIEEGQKDLTVAMLDIDCFKQINDTYGHASGDKALRLLAKAFMTNLTSDIFFARYGGDEFLLIAVSDSSEVLEKTVRDARSSLKEVCLQEGLGFELDFSCGIIQKTPEMKTIPDVLEAADVAMYEVKKAKKAER